MPQTQPASVRELVAPGPNPILSNRGHRRALKRNADCVLNLDVFPCTLLVYSKETNHLANMSQLDVVVFWKRPVTLLIVGNYATMSCDAPFKASRTFL